MHRPFPKNAGIIMDVRVQVNRLCLTSDRRPQILYLDPHRARLFARRLLFCDEYQKHGQGNDDDAVCPIADLAPCFLSLRDD